MTFYTFMMRNHQGNDSPAGDLANDMKQDSEKFPRNRPGKFDGWHKIIYDHLVRNGACDACLHVFEECWEEYKRCEKKRLSRN